VSVHIHNNLMHK